MSMHSMQLNVTRKLVTYKSIPKRQLSEFFISDCLTTLKILHGTYMSDNYQT